MISKEDFSRLLNWYCSGTLSEDDTGMSPVLNSKKLPDPMPATVKELIDAVRKLGGQRLDNTALVFFLADGSTKTPTMFMSGEIVGGEFVYTVRPAELDMMQPVPAAFLCQATEQELKQAGKDTSMAVSVTDGKTRYSITSMQIDTVRFPRQPRNQLLHGDRRVGKTRGVEDGRPDGRFGLYSETSCKGGRPVPGNHVNAEALRPAMLDMPFICRYEESMFSAYPVDATEGQATFMLQKADDPSDMEGEVMTFKEVCQWLYRKDCLGATMFFKNKNDVYEIEDIVYEAGMPPFVDLRPWGQMDESKKPLSESKREILEWKKYCDSDMLYW